MKNLKQRQTLFAASLAVFFLADFANAQDEEKKSKKKEKDIPAVEVVELTTKDPDPVKLKCLFYAGTQGKENVPVIMLHDWDGSRSDFEAYAKELQAEKGFSIIVPDLRGHGESTFTSSGKELDRERWKPAQVASAVADIEACKKFLVGKNNEGELNIDLLSIVAEGVSCIHACEWTINDWKYGYLGGVKQGKDVKSLVLMGPPKSYRSMNLTQTIKHPLFSGKPETALSLMILGNDDDEPRAVRDTKKIFESIERVRKTGGKDEDYLDYFEYQTRRQTKVIKNADDKQIGLAQGLAYFINLATKRFKDDHRWADRDSD